MFRWAAILALLPATAGIVIAIGWPQFSEIGFALVAGGLALAVWLPLIGPLRLGGTRIADEFDRMIQTRAWLAGCAAASFAAVMGLLLLLGLAMAGNWERLTLLLALRSLLSYLIVLLSAVPCLVITSGASADEDD
ncbi:hypothetical protein OF829_07335 [Sphingomonas sp. LB-2]|nr:hypothetical protein [Sphingomonas caeni]